MSGGASCFAVCALLSLANGAQVSPVQKVVQMIDAMANRVQADLDDTTRNFEEFAKYCDDEATAKNYAIKDSLEGIEQFKAACDSSDAKISSLESSIEDISGNIAGQQQELQDSDELRAKEHKQFLQTEQSMLAMIGDLGAAIKGLESGGASFAQLMTQERRSHVDQIVSSLQQVVDSAYVTHAEFDKVHAFLQAREDSEESLAEPKEGEGTSTLAILKQLEERSMNTLADTRNKEQDGAQAHAMLKQSMESEIQSMNEEMQDAAAGKQGATVTLATATKDLTVKTKGLEEDRNALAKLKADCQSRATEFEGEAKDGKAELEALGKATDILTQKFSFIQISASSHTMRVGSDGAGEDVKAKALRRIQMLGKQFGSTALITLAYRASESPFSKVSAMIEDMIAKLNQEAAEDATQKAFCDKELSASKKSKADKETSLRKSQARIDKGNSGVAKLTEGVQILSGEIAAIDAGMAEATKIRNNEKAEFIKAEKDYSESEEACAAAISALREYYEGASFLQVSAQTNSKAQGGGGIIGLLEVAESDFAKLLADARSGEEAAADEYGKMVQEQKMAKMTKAMDVKGKRSQLKGLETSLANYNSDKDGVSTELDAVLAYLDKLKPQCETKTESYAEVKAKRDSEIAGLKDALSMLSGDSPALLQTGQSLRRIRA